MTSSDPHWLGLLRAEAARTSIAATAALLGYSRTSISLALAGRYTARTDTLARVVVERLDTPVDCPYLGETLESDVCRSYCTGPAPSHNPLKMAHWRACQQCQNCCKTEK
ncbi:XRE family transcriptional regulator [Microvirgula aerodenitrificans]|uniref:XRE family transcriptional regulator n=1 Tax=Microvirgula aerodenitrificans TaxID=57480 RepID=UPI0028EC8008|nr:XRE family transcriptional regulator [Microvirgula aerodenitrificans]